MLSKRKLLLDTHITYRVKYPRNTVIEISIIFTLWTKECSVLYQDSIEVVPEPNQQSGLQ